MATANNAYRFTVAEGWEDIGQWWYATNNPFMYHGFHDLGDGEYLLMADISPEAEERLQAVPWCDSYSECCVKSPQVGDEEPEEEHETVDGGDQLLWVS